MKVKAVAFKEVLQTIALAWLSISRRNKKHTFVYDYRYCSTKGCQ